MSCKVLSVNVGQAKPLSVGGRTVQSAIVKRPVDGHVAVRQLGLEGDEQADLRLHGGISKAVYAYPHEHYVHWQTMRAQAQASLWNEALPYGFMGENLTVEGIDETKLWIGDLLRFPGCDLAVSEPRTPCFKFAAVMGFAQTSQMMIQSGWCGFYLAVRVPGTIAAGASFEVVPGPRHIGVVEQFRTLVKGKRRP